MSTDKNTSKLPKSMRRKLFRFQVEKKKTNMPLGKKWTMHGKRGIGYIEFTDNPDKIVIISKNSKGKSKRIKVKLSSNKEERRIQLEHAKKGWVKNKS